ncbi:MAG: PPC domain-containing protein [Planctomycetota bacterium]|nr:PPC domain-containing protein [Planctomycetota bacterium]
MSQFQPHFERGPSISRTCNTAHIVVAMAIASFAIPLELRSETPSVSYVFPAGGQRGTTVDVHVGGHYLYEGCPFRMRGEGVKASPRITRTDDTKWFEGPVIPMPASQRGEDYPIDYAGRIEIAKNAELGVRTWNVWTSQGVTPGMKFVVGDLPETIEDEIDGRPIPTQVSLPITINGRIFPREDIDIWTFDVKQGQVVTCEVNAERLGSPLDSRIEIRDPSGRHVTENTDTYGKDSFAHFVAAASGTYSISIHDVEYGGLQHYVYRLTIRTGPYVSHVYPLGGQRGSTVAAQLHGPGLNGQPATVAIPQTAGTDYRHRFNVAGQADSLFLDVDDLAELVEPNGKHAAITFESPCVLNGRIDQPGQIDRWSFAASKGDRLEFEVRASRLGSRLDSILRILDAEGKVVGQNDDLKAGVTDSKLAFAAPTDGKFVVEVSDRIATRGDERFAYRLRVAPPNPVVEPGFRIFLPGDTVTVERGKEVKVKVDLVRIGGFQEEVQLQIEGLPKGVTVAGDKIAAKQATTQLTFKPDETVKIGLSKLKITGKGTIPPPKSDTKPAKKNAKPAEKKPETTVEPAGTPITQTAVVRTAQGESVIDDVLLHVSMPTPFKFTADFETRYASRGTVYFRKFQLDRNGFTGPIELSLADRQVRHLQGATGPKLLLGPEVKTEFEYNITLASFMEIGRTCRVCIMLVGVVQDKDGSKHKVSFSSNAQNDQVIVLVDPTQLSVRSTPQSMTANPGMTSRIRVDVRRGSQLEGDVEVQLIAPTHIHGITSSPVVVPAGKTHAELDLTFAKDAVGPLNMPLTLRARMLDQRGLPVIGEAPLELVQP